VFGLNLKTCENQEQLRRFSRASAVAISASASALAISASASALAISIWVTTSGLFYQRGSFLGIGPEGGEAIPSHHI
jgi:hypothetical protein